MDDEERILHELRQALSLLFLISKEDITMATRRDDIAAWDSLQHLNVVLEVESRFGLHLHPEQIEAIHGIADIVALVRAHGQSAV